MSDLHAPPLPGVPATPSKSRSTDDVGRIILPRRLGWGVAVSAIVFVFAAGGWAAGLDRRVADLERAKDSATADRKTTSARLERIERTVCVLCTSQIGPGSCPASCRL